MVVSNIVYFHPYLGKIPILTNIFQRGAAAVKHIQHCSHQEIQAEYSPGKPVTMWGVTIRRETFSNGHRTFVIRYEVVRVYYSSIPGKRKKEHLSPTSIPVSMVSYTFWILEDTLSWYWYWELFLWDNPQAIVETTAVHDVHENLHGCGCLIFPR